MPRLLYWVPIAVTGENMTPQQQLRREIAALEHELRRVRDGLERNPSHALEAEVRRLEDNIALCRRELELIRETLKPTPE